MRDLTKILAVVSLLTSANAYPLGIGELKLHSALNQKLSADIALVLAAGEKAADISVRLASPDAFAKQGVPWNAFLSKIKFEPVTTASGAVVIKVTSSEALKEPYLDILLEVQWPKGNLFREFTVLVDPPSVYKAATLQAYEEPALPSKNTPPLPATAVVTPTPKDIKPNVSPSVTAPVAKPPVKEKPTPTVSTASAVTEKTASALSSDNEYGPTRRKETLWNIATRVNQDNAISTTQMAVALFTENPAAFGKGNINNLQPEKLLQIPSRSVVLRLSQAQALATFKQLSHGRLHPVTTASSQPRQHTVLNKEKNLASRKPTPAPEKPTLESKEASTASALAPATVPAQGNAGDKLLKLVAPNEATVTSNAVISSDSKAAPKAKTSSTSKEVEISAADKALQAKLAELEQQLTTMQKVLALKDQQLSALQNQNRSPSTTGKTEIAVKPAPISSEPVNVAPSDVKPVAINKVEPAPSATPPVANPAVTNLPKTDKQPPIATPTPVTAPSDVKPVAINKVEPASSATPPVANPAATNLPKTDKQPPIATPAPVNVAPSDVKPVAINKVEPAPSATPPVANPAATNLPKTDKQSPIATPAPVTVLSDTKPVAINPAPSATPPVANPAATNLPKTDKQPPIATPAPVTAPSDAKPVATNKVEPVPSATPPVSSAAVTTAPKTDKQPPTVETTAAKPAVKPAAPKTPPKPVVKPVTPPPEDDELSTYVIAGVSGGIGLLGLLGFFWWRKRKIDAEFADDSYLAPKESSKNNKAAKNKTASSSKSGGSSKSGAGSGFASLPEDSIGLDTNASNLSGLGDFAPSDFDLFNPSDFDTFDTNQDEIDPVSEADVYLAYGRYQQAEELMRDAIRDQPHRDECKLKLLEIFYANDNKKAFTDYAYELAEAGKIEDTVFWSKVVEMGSELCPDTNLFTEEGASKLINRSQSISAGNSKTASTDIGLMSFDASFEDLFGSEQSEQADTQTSKMISPSNFEDSFADFDFSGFDEGEDTDSDDAYAASLPKTHQMDDDGDSFDDFDLSDFGSVKSATTASVSNSQSAVTTPESSINLSKAEPESSAGDSFNFDGLLDELPTKATPAPQRADEVESVEFNFDDLLDEPLSKAAPAPQPIAEVESVEFDFDGLLDELPSKAAPTPQPIAEVESVEFDFDGLLDEPLSKAAPTPQPIAEVESVEFDFDGLLDETLSKATPAPQPIAEVESVEFDFDGLLDEPLSKATPAPQPIAEVESVEFDFDGLLDEPVDNAAVEPSDPELSFSDFEPPSPTKTVGAIVQETENYTNVDFDFDFDMPIGRKSGAQKTDNDFAELTEMDEVEIKLDLARAYIDMDDTESAKNIVREVLEKGSEEQKMVAQAILDYLN